MELDRVRTHLVRRRKELVERLASIDKSIHHRDEPLSADFAEQAVELENREVLEALDSDGWLELRHIDGALKRIEDGGYGLCVQCGGAIAPGRLEALPTTPVCIDCARGNEAQ
jgi:RNA polymerase-binding protein DksA